MNQRQAPLQYSDENIAAQMQKENSGPWKSIGGPIIDTLENFIPIYDIVHGATQFASGAASNFAEKDKYGVAHNDTMKGVQAGLDWSGSLMNYFDTGDWGNVHQRGREAGLLQKQQEEITSRDKMQQRMSKYAQPQMARQGGMINQYANGGQAQGNAYVNDDEMIVSPSRPQPVQGGDFQQEAPGMYQVNAYKDGTDNVLADIQPGSKVINNHLSKVLKELTGKRKYQQGKLNRASTNLQKDTIQKNISTIDQQMKMIVDMQPSNSEQGQQQFVKGGDVNLNEINVSAYGKMAPIPQREFNFEQNTLMPSYIPRQKQTQMDVEMYRNQMAQGIARAQQAERKFGGKRTQGGGTTIGTMAGGSLGTTGSGHQNACSGLGVGGGFGSGACSLDKKNGGIVCGCDERKEMYNGGVIPGYAKGVDASQMSPLYKLLGTQNYGNNLDIKAMNNQPGQLGKFGSFMQNDSTAGLTMAQGAYGLGQLAYSAFSPVQELPGNSVPYLRNPEKIGPVTSQADWYIRNMPSYGQMAASGMNDPRVAMAMRARAGEQYSNARRQDELVNKQIEQKNQEDLYRTQLANIQIGEQNRGYDMQRKMYKDQSLASKYGGIASGASDVIASLAKILPQVIR